MPYFDHNATAPLLPAAREAWLKASDESWHNASSLHRAGARVKLRLQAAREKVAALMGTSRDRVVFTGGATEAVDAIARHLARKLAADANVAVSAIEHPCVIAALQAAVGRERLRWLPPTADGVVTAATVTEALAAHCIGAVWVMAANNETGVMQPWADIARMCRERGVPYVCDAAQWMGKVSVAGLAEADWVVGAAHKFGGPKGVGFLLRPRDENGLVMREGGHQESGQRAGTEDYPSIASMVVALTECETGKVVWEPMRLQEQARFVARVKGKVPGTVVVGERAERLWNTVALIMPHGENHRWVAKLDKLGFAVSTGSACASGAEAPSHVLAAMGVSGEASRRVIRISAGWETASDDWNELADALAEVAAQLKPAANVVSIP